MELRNRRQASEVYTIRQVAEMTGVPENTIRSWERRFGIPQPARSGSNQRRYTERDVDTIRSIQASRDRGRTMEQAIQDVTNADEKSPAPSQETNEAPKASIPPPPARRAHDPATVSLLASLTAFEGAGAGAIVAERLWATTVETVCVEVLLPAMREIEEQSATGSILASQSRYATAWIRRKLDTALDQSSPDAGRINIVVAAMHDESAQVESHCLAILFSRAGYRVSWLGGSASVDDIAQAIDVLSPAATLLTTRSEFSIVAMKAAIARLESKRQIGDWHGIVAITGSHPPIGENVVELPIHASRTVDAFERALQARDSTLRLVRN
ncbi:MAG: MerR family transcriptional regulator [Chloroflexota bacterium]|nr:MerR family transcriptional regulator [Chloroflexota bacterium]